MKYSDQGSPGKTRTSQTHPIKIAVVLILVVSGSLLITEVKDRLPEAVEEHNAYQEQIRVEEERRMAAEMEAQKREAEALKEQEQAAADKQQKIQEQPAEQKATTPEPVIAPASEPVSTKVEKQPPRSIKPGQVKLSIRNSGFAPVEFIGSALSAPLNIQLYKKQFPEVKKEPGYKGYAQWYGYMDLGNQERRRFHFVLDLQKNETFVLYFDTNKNNDLTDDGGPLKNKGSGTGGFEGFACPLSIPWAYLIETSPFKGNFNIWFFVNEAGWSHGQKASHYSQTQLATVLNIGGLEYKALLVDTGYNDADLGNDGIIIDLNRNNTFDSEEVPALSHVIKGKTYTFRIVW